MIRKHPVDRTAVLLLLVNLFASFATFASAAEIITFHGYEKAIELKNGDTRVVLCPEVGGRVLEYSRNGTNVLYLSEAEKDWKPGDKPQSSAGRFDIGPELVVPRRETLWSGKWQGEITGDRSAKLISQKDAATGVQLIRTFELAQDSSRLRCTQIIINVSEQTREWCHWSRTFAVGKGICVIPLTQPGTSPQTRFPNGYVMYEEGSLINMKPDDPQIRRRDNVLEIHPTPRKPKLGFDSYAGIIAYAAPNDLLFVKRFQTYPNRVYNEAAGLTISVWYPDNEMIELEPIGPREILAPGDSASFTEDWWLADFQFPGPQQSVDLKAVRSAVESMQ
ncbi:MAG: hypothetical protein R3C59_13455 [Planctomycetaceae bacterium]